MPAVSEPLASAFVVKNRQMYDRLVTFLDFAPERFTLGFVSVNFGRDRSALAQALQVDPRNADLQIVALEFADRELRYFKDALVERLATITIEPNKKLVLVITGLEFAIGLLGEYPLVLQDLNYIRDAFVHTVPYPILFVLPDGALTRLAKFAPDLWAWRKSVFSFESSEMAVESAHGMTLDSGRLDGSLSEDERHDRIDLLERLLTDPNQQHSDAQRARLCNELGKHYRDLGRVDEARTQLDKSLHIAEDQTLVKAKALQEMGELCRNQGKFECALNYAKESVQISHQLNDYQTEAYALSLIADIEENQGNIDKSLQLREQILQLCEQGDYPFGKAATLSNMASVIAQQGDIERALQLWQEDFEISERIGDVKGKATTLNNMANVIAQQGDIEQAVKLWQESLKILDQIGYVKGKVATLTNMAGMIAQQGDIERAVKLWQESLKIAEQIGDVKGKAATLNNMASVIAQQGDIERAVKLWQESLKIAERIGDVNAEATTLNNIAGMIAQQGDIEQALQLWQESLEIAERIGNVKAKAIALSNMAWGIATQRNTNQAVKLWQESLEILDQIDDVKSKADTLKNISSTITYLESILPHLENNYEVKASKIRKDLDAIRQLYRRYTSHSKGFIKPPSKGPKKRK